jgi:nitroimidazol reductase NimA-like FMN-containing flavoprotein (pyridoxamine 5'-phosphate oxidase superfamily)
MPLTLANSCFEVLTYEECVDFLGCEEIGRIAWVSDGRPTLVPVNYAWDGEAVVIRSDPGLKLTDILGNEVAFEIDRIDRARKQGWSVVVQGAAHEVSIDDWPATALQPHEIYLEPWVAGAKLHWVRLIPRLISGRRIRRMTETEANPFWFFSTVALTSDEAIPR